MAKDIYKEPMDSKISDLFFKLLVGLLWNHQQHDNPVICHRPMKFDWVDTLDRKYDYPILINRDPVIKAMVNVGLVDSSNKDKDSSSPYDLELTKMGLDLCSQMLFDNCYHAYEVHRNGRSWREPRPKTFWYKIYKKGKKAYSCNTIFLQGLSDWIKQYPHHNQFVKSKSKKAFVQDMKQLFD